MPATCRSCRKPVAACELAAYRGCCEDCWVGGYSSPDRLYAEYYGYAPPMGTTLVSKTQQGRAAAVGYGDLQMVSSQVQKRRRMK